MNLKGLELFGVTVTDLDGSPGGDPAVPISCDIYTNPQSALIAAIEYADSLCADMVKEENIAFQWNVRHWHVEYNDMGAVIFCDDEPTWDIEIQTLTVKE